MPTIKSASSVNEVFGEECLGDVFCPLGKWIYCRRLNVARASTFPIAAEALNECVMRISFRSDRQDAKLGPVPATHCADLLTARENLRCCNVRRCQENCDKLLHWLTTDRGAPFALYPAIKRSMSRASPVLRNSSTSCDQTKSGSASQEQIACRFRAVDMQALW